MNENSNVLGVGVFRITRYCDQLIKISRTLEQVLGTEEVLLVRFPVEEEVYLSD